MKSIPRNMKPVSFGLQSLSRQTYFSQLNSNVVTTKFRPFMSSASCKKLIPMTQDGQFKRAASSFRDSISTASGAKFPPEADRYHLYVSLACPWAHRTLLTRHLKGLTNLISVNVVDWYMGSIGWQFTTPDLVPGTTPDELYGATTLREIYFRAVPDYEGRFSVPVLWDKKTQTIVNNESSEIIRMFYTEFDEFIEDPKYKGLTFYPADLAAEIDALNDWVYSDINNGVYKAGFAETQAAYDENVTVLFKSLNRVEELLKKSAQDGNGPYLLGERLTEADIRLFTTIIRFDPVYVQHFKCNLGMIRYDFPAINKWLLNLYWNVPGFKETTDFTHIKSHYTKSHPSINPLGITPLGPIPDILPMA